MDTASTHTTSSTGTNKQLQQAQAVEEAVQTAYNTIQSISADLQLKHDTPKEDVMAELDTARLNLQRAWQDLHNTKEEDAIKDKNKNDQVRLACLAMITDSFGDVLDEMRNQETIVLEVLVDCLQSGLDLVCEFDEELLVEDDNDDNQEDGPYETPHERRRRALGYRTVPETLLA